MLYPFRRSPIVRFSLRDEEPDPAAVVGPRPRGTRRPHTDETVARVRRLIEETTLTYEVIAIRTGVGRASICRWTRDGGWKRPLFAPRATDTVPRARAGARLKQRTLAARLAAVAERYVRELEETPGVDLDKLDEALELVKMARLAARKRRGRPQPAPTGPEAPERREAMARAVAKCDATGRRNLAGEPDEAPQRTAMRELRAAGVRTQRVPEDVLEDFITHRVLPREKPLRRRGRRFTRADHHAWMLEKERP